jgi:hypothetical protein
LHFARFLLSPILHKSLINNVFNKFRNSARPLRSTSRSLLPGPERSTTKENRSHLMKKTFGTFALAAVTASVLSLPLAGGAFAAPART